MASARAPVLITYEPRIIAKYLNQKLSLGLSPEDISSPTAEVAQQVYLNFLKYALNTSDQSLTSLPLSATSDYDPEMHRGSIQVIIVYNCLKAFLHDNSGGKLILSMCDLVEPAIHPNRFRRIASFIVDFMKLHEAAMPHFDEISEEFSDRKTEMQELEKELVHAERRRNELVAQKSLQKRREHDLINEHTKVNEELSAIIAAYTQNAETSEALKKQETEVLQKIEQLEGEILSESKMVEHLNGEILSSPEELKAEMAERKKQIAELQECRRNVKKDLATKTEGIDICSKVEKNSSAIADKIQALSTVKSELLQQLDQLNVLEEELREADEELKFMAARKIAVDERLVENGKSHEQLRQGHVQRDESLKKQIAALVAEIENLTHDQPCVSKDIESKRNELLSVKNALSKSVATNTELFEETMAKFNKIKSAFDAQVEKTRIQWTCVTRAGEVLKSTNRRLSEFTFSETTLDGDRTDQDATLRL